MRFHPVWHYPPERWDEPSTLLSPKQDTLRKRIPDELRYLVNVADTDDRK